MSVKITDWTPEYFIEHKVNCIAILQTSNIIEEIPLLNNASLDDLKDRQLVRFRGMIQDMHNPEYYFSQYEVKNMQTGDCHIKCGMYRDSARCLPCEEILINSSKNKSSERQTCVAISTPGLNMWAKEKIVAIKNANIVGANSSIYKRKLNEQKQDDMDCDEPCQKKEKISNEDTAAMDVVLENNMKQNIVSKEHLLNFPIPTEDGKACIIKIYEETSLKLNQVVEIVGFISLDPSLSTIHNADDTMTEEEISTHNPPTSLIPRLHAIKILHLAKHEVPNAPDIISKAQIIRSELHMMLGQLLFGDILAADFLICHLLSSVYMRRDYFCLGTYPLNITHFPVTKYKTFPKDFYNFLTLVVKKSHLMDITLESLNDLALLPKKDYDCNRLTSGVLQLSDHTHLVLDETGLTTGQISVAGKENYNAICDLVNFQRVTYDFKFYKMEYEADIPILIFSEAKSFIPCPTQVKLKIDHEAEDLYPQVLEMAYQYLKDENRLANIRQYLEVLRHTEFELNDDIIKIIQEDFITMRQTNKNIGVDHLHSLMILSRLLSLSYGANTLSTEHWKAAVQMELQRIERLPPKK